MQPNVSVLQIQRGFGEALIEPCLAAVSANNVTKSLMQASTVPTVQREIIQAALSWKSPYIGQRVHDANFEQLNAYLLAVHRSGICLPALSDIHLQPGDVLLLEVSDSFAKHHKDDEGFALVSVVDISIPVNCKLSVMSLVLVILLVAIQVGTSEVSFNVKLLN